LRRDILEELAGTERGFTNMPWVLRGNVATGTAWLDTNLARLSLNIEFSYSPKLSDFSFV